MDNQSSSVYHLITKLCEKYSSVYFTTRNSKKNDIKTARSQCYEILLSKRFPKKELKDELENNSDPVCHLLAWQYQLMSKYDLPHHGEKLKTCIEKLQELNVFEDTTYSNLVMFLLQLRSVPLGEDKIMETTLNRDCLMGLTYQSTIFPFFDESKFQLPKDEICFGSHFAEDHFKLRNKKVGFKTTGLESVADFLNARQKHAIPRIKSSNILCGDEGYESSSKSQEFNIWEFAASNPPSEHRTWETYGCINTIKERPFICESGPKAVMWLLNVSTNFENLIMENNAVSGITRNVITNKQLIRDIKYLLVGMQSNTFSYDDKQELSLRPGTCVEGLSPGAIESYCKDLIFCSSCYMGLNNLCASEQCKTKDKPGNTNKGYIFVELCESIRRYLSYYRIAVFSLSDSSNLLMFHEQTRQLRTYMTVLASVCKVGPFTESGHIPHGIALLNYLYQKVMSLTDNNVLMVLYSILYPCCQVYFSRFLQQWILDGTVHDPYGEFFINVNPKYVTTRGRTYWTRSYTLREDIVPDFITDLRSDILYCGKAMNLLKTCVPSSPLCLYLMDKRPDITACCLMAEQLSTLEQNNYYYYLEATALCGPRISLSQIILSSKEQDDSFVNLIAKKRAVTLRRIKLEKQKEMEKQTEKRRAEMAFLQEQYAEALKLKQAKQLEELEEEIRTIEKDIRLQTLHDRIIQEEASNLMEYYNKLFEVSENKRLFYEKRVQELKKTKLEIDPDTELNTLIDIDRTSVVSSSSSDEIYYSADRKTSDRSVNSSEFVSIPELIESKSDNTVCSNGSGNLETHNETNLDVINANSVTKDMVEEEQENIKSEQVTNTLNIAVENYKAAQRNKAKVLAHEMGIIAETAVSEPKKLQNDNSELTEAQKNKLKVMSSEFGMDIKQVYTSQRYKPGSMVEFNRNKMMASSDCFLTSTSVDLNNQCDNENFINRNFTNDVNKNNVNVDVSVINDSDTNSNIEKWVTRKQDVLLLDFTKLDNNNANKFIKTEAKYDSNFNLKPSKGPKFELEKLSPMSVDSTPLSGLTTPSRLTVSLDKIDFDNQCSSEMVTATTANTHFENGFKFEMDASESYFNFENRKTAYNIQIQIESAVLSKSITVRDAEAVSNSCLKLCLEQSISIPLVTQIKLVTNELLKYFINDLGYLKHLNSLRNYFFMLDGEFGRNITEGLFEKLYDANFPTELINCRTLKVLVFKAMDYSVKFQENSDCVSFKINNLPKIFDLGDPDVFDCISLTYKTGWPLNILLPSDTIGKYDEVFKFVLKLHRISWVLQNIFQDLKSLMKQAESHKMILLMSPHYRRLHQCRHVMTQFIQTLQSYVVGEVLHSSWEIFEKNLESVTNIDQMYALHTSYIKNILFMCLLNQKSAPIRKVLQKIFIVILKFYDYLRSRMWEYEDCVYVHPNFKKLEDIFANFEDLVLYLFKVGHKVVKSGYQPHLMQLLDMLDVNSYYSKRNVIDSSLSISSR